MKYTSMKLPHSPGSRCKGNQISLLSLSSCFKQESYPSSQEIVDTLKLKVKLTFPIITLINPVGPLPLSIFCDSVIMNEEANKKYLSHIS